MKTTVILSVLFIAVHIFGCKRQSNITDIVEEVAVNRVPNKSDEHFSEALASLQKNNDKDAAMYLKKGVEQLQKEGEEVSGLYKVNLDRAIGALNKITSDLENAKNVPVEAIKEAIVNAEINIAHEYLSSSDIFILDNPENIPSGKIKRQFNHNLAHLKKNKGGDMNDDEKLEREALIKDGEEIVKSYQEWEQKTKEFIKKANAHFKEHDPKQYTEPYYWVF